MMDSAMQSSTQEHADTKTAFRKPLNDAANRKYRRRSPISGSSSSGGSPSPVLLKEDSAKVADERRRKDDGRDLDRDSVRNRHGRNSDSYRHPDQHSSRSSHSHQRHDDRSRREKHVQNELSSRSGRDNTRRETENDRSIDAHSRDVDRHSRDKYESFGYKSRDKERDASSVEYHRIKDKDLSSERAGSDKKLSNSEDVKSGERDRRKSNRDGRVEKKDYRRDYKDDRSPTYGESKGYRYDSNSQWGNSGHLLKESSGSDHKELDGHRHTTEEKKKYGAREISRHRDGYKREPGDQFEEKSVSTGKDRESPAKKPKLFSLDGSSDHKKDEFKSARDEKQSPTSKQAEESVGKVKLEQSYVTDSDIDAAKVAAMKAAELVNRNLIGTGYMSTDQKKKLLWGNKKNTAVEESTHRWNTALFDDHERQEKFNKLMGVKGDAKVEHKPDNQDGTGLLQAEKQNQLQLDLEKQYTAGLRRRDGRTVGLGL